jgi:hypothetical protein
VVLIRVVLLICVALLSAAAHWRGVYRLLMAVQPAASGGKKQMCAEQQQQQHQLRPLCSIDRSVSQGSGSCLLC